MDQKPNSGTGSNGVWPANRSGPVSPPRVRVPGMSKREIFDVCVIGTGAGGGVMLQELCAAGLEVVALERGPKLDASHFVSDDELSIVVRDELFSPEQVETWRPDENTPTETGRFNMFAHCVGGTMTHWAAWSWRFLPDDFEVLSKEGPVAGASLADWPIRYEELEPFYERAESDFGVSGDAKSNAFAPKPKRAYPNPPHPLRRGSEIFSAAAKNVAVSRTLRVSTPCAPMSTGMNFAPSRPGSRPREHLSPTRPQKAAGMRIDPPPSFACERGSTPEATSAPDPPDEPPGECSRFQGLRVAPVSRGSVVPVSPNSGSVDLPTGTNPSGSRIFSTKGDERLAGTSGMAREPMRVGTPASESVSFTKMGTPANAPWMGPSARLRAPS